MTVKERETLFKIHEAIKKLSQPPLTTNTPLTGQVQEQQGYNTGSNSLPLLNTPQPKG